MELLPYQIRCLKRIEAAKQDQTNGHLINFGMGQGKTRVAIEAIKHLDKILVLAPAIARKTWEKEVVKWWPTAPEVELVTGREQAMFVQPSGIKVASYALAQYIGPLAKDFDAVIFDEIHCLQDDSTKRTQAAYRLVKDSPNALRLGLTGTALTNKIASGWGPLSVLFPPVEFEGKERYRFGPKFAWCMRYMESFHNGYGWSFEKVHEEHLQELKHRIGIVSTRATAAELEGLLPAFSVQTNWITDRDKGAVDWSKNAYESGAEKQVIFTFRRATATAIGEAIQKKAKYPIRIITGAMPVEKREAAIDEIQHGTHGCVIATMDSVGISIPMNFFNVAAISEFPPKAVSLGQTIGRLHRIGGSVPLTILAPETGDRNADMLAGRIKAINAVIEAGEFEKAMKSMTSEMRSLGKTEAEIQESMQLAALDFDDWDL